MEDDHDVAVQTLKESFGYAVHPSILMVGAVVCLICAGCGGATVSSSAGVAAHTATPSLTVVPFPTASPTPKAAVNCQSITPPPGTIASLPIPLPANTISIRLPGAAGAGFYRECTPGGTQASITGFMNAHLPLSGWHQWNPSTDDAGGCGTEANSYWLWVNSQDAIGWDYHDVSLPEWHLTFCTLAYATPAG